MRETSKTINFDFNFRYPRMGQYDEANCITVCEPGFDKRQVFRKMGATVAEAQAAAMKKYASSADAATEAASEAPTPETDDGKPVEIDTLMIVRMGMTSDEYTRFCDYVQKELTGCKSLAFVGSSPEDRVPVTDEVWMNIANAGGVEAIDKIISGFAGFFSLIAAKSPTSSGTQTSSSSEASAAVSSRTKKR